MGALFDAIKKLQSGMTVEQLEKEYDAEARRRAKEPGKKFGECESCGQKTCLVAEVDLCGPCCFGESETINGNW